MPSPPQAECLRFLLEHEARIAAAVRGAIFASYPGLKDELSDCYDDEELNELMPPLASADELKALIGLSVVHLLRVAQGGIAYLGFEFGCNWDDEHGLGVMTHKDRIVSIGQADTSFLEEVGVTDSGAL